MNARDHFVKSVLETPNRAHFPPFAYAGDICKVADVYWVYIQKKWVTMEDATKMWEMDANSPM